MKSTYLIPDCNLAELEARIAKLNKRAAKLGVPEILFSKAPDHVKYQVSQLQSGSEIGGPMTKLVWRTSIEKKPEAGSAYLANAFEPTGVVMQWWKVEVSGESPALSDWGFVAILEPLLLEDGSEENFVRALPGEVCPHEFRGRVGECDHCKAARNRKQTFVVRHADGSHKVVGRTCLKDFLGSHGDPHELAAWAEMLAELSGMCEGAGEEGWGGGGWRDSAWDVKHFLAMAACRIRKFGWVSRGAARYDWTKTPTANVVLDILTPSSDPYSRESHEKLVAEHVVEDGDRAKAEAAIDWAKELSPDVLEKNDYLANVNLVSRVGIVSRKTAGVAASIIVAYNKAVDIEAERVARESRRVARESRPASEWIGEIGTRIKVLAVKVEKVIATEGFYGTTGVHKMVDESGNDLTWFASAGEWLKEGESYRVSATPKKHGEYKGRKQTVLNRVSVWTDECLAAHLAKEEKKSARVMKKMAKAV